MARAQIADGPPNWERLFHCSMQRPALGNIAEMEPSRPKLQTAQGSAKRHKCGHCNPGFCAVVSERLVLQAASWAASRALEDSFATRTQRLLVVSVSDFFFLPYAYITVPRGWS